MQRRGLNAKPPCHLPCTRSLHMPGAAQKPPWRRRRPLAADQRPHTGPHPAGVPAGAEGLKACMHAACAAWAEGRAGCCRGPYAPQGAARLPALGMPSTIIRLRSERGRSADSHANDASSTCTRRPAGHACIRPSIHSLCACTSPCTHPCIIRRQPAACTWTACGTPICALLPTGCCCPQGHGHQAP